MLKLTNLGSAVKFGLLLLAAGVAQAQAQPEENYVTAGSAYNLENNQLIYRELYTAINADKEVRVDYMTPEGLQFATKLLSYKGALFQPEFVFKDKRDDEELSAQFQGARLMLRHSIGTSANEKLIMDNARVVIDAGFDAYIQLHWDKLLAGKVQKFEFAMPSRLETLALEVRKLKGRESPLYNAEFGHTWVYFRITPARRLLSFFSDPIYLAYDPNGKYLMRFQGRSNIDDERGGPWDVRIEYEYLN